MIHSIIYDSYDSERVNQKEIKGANINDTLTYIVTFLLHEKIN
jgi:hypothetical protein